MLEEKGEEGDVGMHLRLQQLRDRDKITEGKGAEAEKESERKFFRPPEDAEERKCRSEEEMRAEAQMLRRELEKDGIFSTFPTPSSSISTFQPKSAEEGAAKVAKPSTSTSVSGNDLFPVANLRFALTNVAFLVAGIGLGMYVHD